MPEEERGIGEADRRTMDQDAWQKREHDAVLGTLASALSEVRFPADRSEIAEKVGGLPPVSPDVSPATPSKSGAAANVPLVKYVQALPDRRYESADEVTRTLQERWQDIAGLRDAGYEAAANRGRDEA